MNGKRSVDFPEEYYVPTKEDLMKVADMWADAFMNYPMYKWIIPDEEKRKKLLPIGMKVLANYGLKYGHIVATSKEMEGVGIFVMPEDFPITTWKLLRSGMFKALFKWPWKYLKRWIDLEAPVKKMMKKYAPEPFAYLMFGAVTPNKQGIGIGTAGLKAIIAELDKQGISAYGETFKKKNAMLYDYIGLKLVGENPVPGTDLTIYSVLHKVGDPI